MAAELADDAAEVAEFVRGIRRRCRRGETHARTIHGELTLLIRETAFDIHRYLGPGFLEKVYRNALEHRLRRHGLHVEPEKKLTVRDQDGTPIGEYLRISSSRDASSSR